MRSVLIVLTAIGVANSAKIRVSRPTVQTNATLDQIAAESNPFVVDELCVRMHNNTAFSGVDPYERQKLKSANECQRKCVDSFPKCKAVVFYYVHGTKKHFCFLFDKNSVDEKIGLVEEKPLTKKDVVRSLEIVVHCGQFDAHPPLADDGIVSSTDHASRGKRDNQRPGMPTDEPWTSWSTCSTSDSQVRSQVCDYGRVIQRRQCKARSPDQPELPPPQRPYPPHLNHQPQPEQRHPDQRHPDPDFYRPLPPQPDRRFDLRPTQQHVPQFRPQDRRDYHPADPVATPCPTGRPLPGGGCPTPTPASRCPPVFCPPATPAMGQWAEWSVWGQCSCTCGPGQKSRQRTCQTGNNCQGPSVETVPCELQPCETWSQWCEWSDCKGPCGQGERTRTRFCLLGTQRCEGKDYEAEPCDSGPCPEWSSWESWSQCSVTCGHGVLTRRRTCLGDQFQTGQCQGPATEEQPCDLGECSFWAQWEPWSACSATCGDGMKRRTRVCQYGTECVGISEETLFCNGPPCSSWTEWCAWSPCSSQCGPGTKERTRTCMTATGAPSEDCYGPAKEQLMCSEQHCCMWGSWCPWSNCDRDCGGGQAVRSRSCERPGGESSCGLMPPDSGEPLDDSCRCEGPDRETKECNTHGCTPQCQWTQWCPWGQCSAATQCDTGVQARQRQCVGEAGCHCPGFAEESQQCRGPLPCPPPPPSAPRSGSC